MGYESINFLYLSELLNLPVVNEADGRQLGRIEDMAAATGQVYPKVTGLLIRARGPSATRYVPWSSVRKADYRRSISLDLASAAANGFDTAKENEILLRKSFFDKQIISTSGYKVVRVNDLQLLVDNSAKGTPGLWLVHIDIGVKGLLRRLGWARPFNAAFRWIVGRDIRDKFVSWKHVQPTSTTSVYGSLHLKTDSSKLSEIHPADLADILEDLGSDERLSMLESLDRSTAAATLQEMPIRLRVQVAESLDLETMTAILHEMPVDEVVDLLDEFTPERRSSVLAVLPPETVDEIKELSRQSARRVGSIMNTDFIAATSTQPAGEVLAVIKERCEKTELFRYVYVLDQEEHVKGVVSLRYLITADPGLPVCDLMQETVQTVTIDTTIKVAAQVFFKYNFEALPVVDEEQRMLGIITIRDTLESRFPEIVEES